MLKGLRPPTHRVDAPGVFIFATDTAWDSERIGAELEALIAAKLEQIKRDAVEAAARGAGVDVADLSPEQRAAAEASCVLTEAEQADARARHPVMRYHAGATRYQPSAPDVGPRGPACAADYLRPGVDATEFVLRRINYARRAAVELERDLIHRLASYVRAGVSAIRCGGAVLWEARDPAETLPPDWLDALADADGGAAVNLIALAAACKKYSDPPREADELPRFASTATA